MNKKSTVSPIHFTPAPAPAPSSAPEPSAAAAAPRLAQPTYRKRRWPYPLIWLIPVLSLLCAGLYFRDYLANRGPEVMIDFEDATGVRVGETKVLYRGADVGRVTSVKLSEDHRRARVAVQFDKSSAIFATRGARFWIVRPEVSESGLSGLGTLFTGAYVGALPGQGGEEISQVVGIAREPRPFIPGKTFVLTARQMGHVQEGSAVSYKGVQVGTVQKVMLSKQADLIQIEISVWTRYAALVRDNSKFWIASGFNLEGGIFSGVSLKLDSLRTLTSGGIGFATPDKPLGVLARKGATFAIEDKPEKDWALWSPKIGDISPRATPAPKAEPLPTPKEQKESKL